MSLQPSWSATSFSLRSHSQSELLRTGLGQFQLRQGLATSSSRAGGMVVPLYPAGFSGLPYRLERRKRSQYYHRSPSMNSLQSLPSLHQLKPTPPQRANRPLSSVPRPPGSTGPVALPKRASSAASRTPAPAPKISFEAPSAPKPKPTAAFAEPVAAPAPSAPSAPSAVSGSYFEAVRDARKADKAKTKAKAAPSAPPAPPPKKETSALVSRVEESLNNRFSDMFLAFKYLDVDNSGYLNESELSRALDLWHVPHSPESLRALMNMCDRDENGEVSYAEFVKALARDTVQVATTAQERDKFGGRSAETVADIDPTRGVFGKKESKSLGGQDLYLNAQQGITGKSGDVVGATRDAAEGRFTNLYKAFKYADLDNSGTLNAGEIEKVLKLWNVPIDEEEIAKLMNHCDKDGDGNVSYHEFAAALER